MKTKGVHIRVGAITFTADLPVTYSKGFPDKEMVDAKDVARLEQAVALWIMQHGTDGPDSLRILRSAAGLTGSQLADLLGVDRARISEWENGKAHPGRALYSTLAAIARDAIAGKSDTVDYLRAMSTEQGCGGEIRLAVG